LPGLSSIIEEHPACLGRVFRRLADLEDNMDMRRLSILKEKDAERLHKYHWAWLALRQVEDTAR